MSTPLRRFGQFARPYRARLCGGVVLAVATVACGLAQPWPLKVVVDEVLAPAPGGGPGVLGRWLPGPDTPGVLVGGAIGILLLIVAVGAMADFAATVLMESAGRRIGNDLREAVFDHLCRLSLRYHGTARVGDLAARVTADVDRIQDTLVALLSVLVPNALLLAGMVVVMTLVDPVFAALSLLASPAMAWLIHRSTLAMKAASRDARAADGRVAATAAEQLGAIAVVQAFSLERRSLAEFHALNEESLGANLTAVRHSARLGPLVDLTSAVSTAVVLGVGVQRVVDGRLSLGVLLVFLAYVASLYKPVKALSKLTFALSRGSACAERVAAVLDEAPDVADLPGAVPAPRLAGGITFAGVSFSYGREAVLADVSFEVAPGELIALVGPTGAGKSTLASLIPRFFDPDRGAVLVDGADARRFTLASLRSQIALVPQESVLFRASLWENIACGQPGASAADVRRAAELALVDEFAARLPDGYASLIGERGADLSGGQRQRVAIARAILRDSPILVLDEPTSALDAESESLVVAALANLMGGRTTLVIAHRLSTVRRADRIVVLADGRVVETGTHDELLRRGGTYARLSSLQSGVVDLVSRRQPATSA